MYSRHFSHIMVWGIHLHGKENKLEQLLGLLVHVLTDIVCQLVENGRLLYSMLARIQQHLHHFLGSHIMDDSMDIVIVLAMLHSLHVLMSMVHIGQVVSNEVLQLSSILLRVMQAIELMELTMLAHRQPLSGNIQILDYDLCKVTTVKLQIFVVSKINKVNVFSPDFFGSFFIYCIFYDRVYLY